MSALAGLVAFVVSSGLVAAAPAGSPPKAPPAAAASQAPATPATGPGAVTGAGPGASGVPAPAWGAPLTWREGAQERQAWVDPQLLAEVAPDGAGADAVLAADPAGRVAFLRPRVRVWQVRDAKAVQAALPRAVAARCVPVLRDAPTARAKLRVAAGGVVVQLAESLGPAERAAWARAHGAAPRLGGVYVVDVGPGPPSLELAATLAAEPGVALAAPDWWMPGTPR